ncbi:hypothetical protein Tco_0133723 [Tanacetum coccineum]
MSYVTNYTAYERFQVVAGMDIQAELNALTDLVKLFVRESIRAAGVAGLGVIVRVCDDLHAPDLFQDNFAGVAGGNDPERVGGSMSFHFVPQLSGKHSLDYAYLISVGNLWGEVMPFFFTNWVQSLPVRTSTFGVKKVNPAVEELFDTDAEREPPSD